MNLRQLRHFVALAERGNFHRAAAALNMSQPPLSVSIRKLEEELGAELFVRSARGVELTEAGAAGLPLAREALSAAEAFSRGVRETGSGERGRLRLGFVGSATHALIPAVISDFRRSHPRVELRLEEATSLNIVRGVEEGVLDVGIVRSPLLVEGRVQLEPLTHEALVLMIPQNHRLCDRPSVRLEELREEPFVVFDRRNVPNLWALTMMACEAAGFLPKVAEEASHIHTMVALVESGLGLALAPSVVARAAPHRVRCVPLTAAGQPLPSCLALATRAQEARRTVADFAEVARRCGRQIDTDAISTPG